MRRRSTLALGLASVVSPYARSQLAPAPGSAPIDWPRFNLLNGAAVEPAAWLGQHSIVVFWATWCPYCKRHNARIDKLYRLTKDQPLRVLGVAVDGDARLVMRYMQTNDYSFPVALDTVGLQARLSSRKSIPLTCVINAQGRLVQSIPGEMSEEDVLAFGKLAKSARS